MTEHASTENMAALCGATGRAGSRILEELLLRGFPVLAIVREAGSTFSREGVSVVVDDLSKAERTADLLKGAAILIIAYAPPPDDAEELVPVTEQLVRAVSLSGVSRFLMVGGAGSLEVTPGITLLASGKLSPAWEPLAVAHGHALEVLRISSINRTSLSPAAYFDPGIRSGKFRLGTEGLILDSEGNSSISMEDYAIAMVDEAQHPQHIRRRFSVGY